MNCIASICFGCCTTRRGEPQQQRFPPPPPPPPPPEERKEISRQETWANLFGTVILGQFLGRPPIKFVEFDGDGPEGFKKYKCPIGSIKTINFLEGGEGVALNITIYPISRGGEG